MKENPTTSETMVSENEDNVGLFSPNGKNQEKFFPQNSSPKNASKSNEHLGKLNIDQSVEEINEEINERGSYQPPDGQDISRSDRSRSPESEIHDTIRLTIFDHTHLVHTHWLAFCIHVIVRYVKRDFLYTQLKYYNIYALEITHNWLSFIPCKFQ